MSNEAWFYFLYLAVFSILLLFFPSHIIVCKENISQTQSFSKVKGLVYLMLFKLDIYQKILSEEVPVKHINMIYFMYYEGKRTYHLNKNF